MKFWLQKANTLFAIFPVATTTFMTVKIMNDWEYVGNILQIVSYSIEMQKVSIKKIIFKA